MQESVELHAEAGSRTPSRRNFLTASAVAATAISAAPALRGAAVISRLRIGFIGPGRRGFAAHVQTAAKLRKAGVPVELVGVSDVYELHLRRAADFIAAETGAKPAVVFRAVRDFWLLRLRLWANREAALHRGARILS